MFKIKEYKDVSDYLKKTIVSTSAIVCTLSLGITGTNFLVSLIALYLLVTYVLVKGIAIFQPINVTEERNTKLSWLTRARYAVQ